MTNINPIFQKNEIEDLNITPLSHTEVLDELITKISPVNFQEKANLKQEEQLKHAHILIITIETILDAAKSNNWDMCRNHDFIYIYNGMYWEVLDIDSLKYFLGRAAEKMNLGLKCRGFSFKDNLYKQFLASAYLPKPKQYKDKVLINLKNGTFEITPNGNGLRSFEREDFITYQLPFAYDPYATSPQFEAYLNKVLPDKTLQSILSEYLGYIFIRPSTLKLEKTLLLYGKGANGKSVFYEIVRKLLGEQNTSEYSLQNLTNGSGYQRAMIAHKLVNYASEINGRLEASTFKQLVSGEPVEARLPYGNPFIMTDYAKLIFNCNELPKDVEQTDAYFRRFLIIPFDVSIPEHEQDKQLAKKIIDNELSGVFNWMLNGLKRLLDNKQFTDSEKVRRVRDQYRTESDSTHLFINESGYHPSIDYYVTIKVLYCEYKAYCLDNGYRPLNNINFKKRLENLNIQIDRKNVGQIAFVTKTYGG